MSALDLEVVWPLHKRHYLSTVLTEAIDMPIEPESAIDMTTDPAALEDTATEASPEAPRVGNPPLPPTLGRKLAVRALLAGGCLQQRVAELLHTHRRSVGRMAETDVTDALRDADMVAQARTCLADTASRGSTAKEREAAEVWLVRAMRDEQHVERFHQRTRSRRPVVKRNGAVGPVKRSAMTPATQGATLPGPSPAMFAPDQVDALTRQQQRIVHRSALLAYVIAAETRSGQPLALGDALTELLGDISEAARAIGTILQAIGNARTDN